MKEILGKCILIPQTIKEEANFCTDVLSWSIIRRKTLNTLLPRRPWFSGSDLGFTDWEDDIPKMNEVS